jgi:hypothetical protein
LTWSRQLAPNRPDSPRQPRNFACFSNPLEIEMLIHERDDRIRAVRDTRRFAVY